METWPSHRVIDNELEIQGYFFIRKDGQDANGGGVGAYINSKFAYKQRPDLEDNNVEECKWVQMTTSVNAKYFY